MANNNDDLLRYSRHILLPQLGPEGQEKIQSSTVLVVGLGGLGSAVALYLASCGVKRLLVLDNDEVDLSNLQRQILYTPEDIGDRKTSSAMAMLKCHNPEMEVVPYDMAADADNLQPLVAEADVVADATDNFAARYAINRVCWDSGKPLVSAAAIRFEAQLTVFDPSQAQSPCYQCLYPPNTAQDESCVNNGVLAPLVGVVGSMQAVETLKLLAGVGESLVGRLLLFDALSTQWREVKLQKDPNCEVCG